MDQLGTDSCRNTDLHTDTDLGIVMESLSYTGRFSFLFTEICFLHTYLPTHKHTHTHTVRCTHTYTLTVHTHMNSGIHTQTHTGHLKKKKYTHTDVCHSSVPGHSSLGTHTLSHVSLRELLFRACPPTHHNSPFISHFTFFFLICYSMALYRSIFTTQNHLCTPQPQCFWLASQSTFLRREALMCVCFHWKRCSCGKEND